MTILSGGIGEDGRPLDPVPLEGHVSVTLRVNVYDSLDYIQAGKMDKIFTQINDIVYEQTKALARLNKPETIASTSEVISGPLRLHLQGNVFEQNSFGVDIVKVQARFDLPEEILEALKESGAEKYQRTGELAEYETDTIGAVKLQARLEADPRMAGRVPGLDQCLTSIARLRLIRDGRVARIETDGNVTGLIIRDQNLDMGARNEQRSRRNQRGARGGER